MTSLIKRERPYIWITWLTKLLTGRDSCIWSVWFRANYQGHVKVPAKFDAVNWNIHHTALLNKVEREYRRKYQVVRRENQNAFHYRGQSGAVVAGEPDLIAIDGNLLRICDVKTGQRQDEHWVQMLLYMHFYPRCYPQLFAGLDIIGELVYPDGQQEVYADEIDHVFRAQLTALLQQIASDEAPALIPSARECGNCNIAVESCEARVEKIPESSQAELGDF